MGSLSSIGLACLAAAIATFSIAAVLALVRRASFVSRMRSQGPYRDAPEYFVLPEPSRALVLPALGMLAVATVAFSFSGRPAGPVEITCAPVAAPAPLIFASEDPLFDSRGTVLRMSAPITRIDGIEDESGFTVTIPGVVSLDRAAPIVAASDSIERASIVNRGDHAVLTVRYAAGRSPRFVVAAVGSSLHVMVGP